MVSRRSDDVVVQRVRSEGGEKSLQMLQRLRESSVWRKVEEVSRRVGRKESVEGPVNGFIPIQKSGGWCWKLG